MIIKCYVCCKNYDDEFRITDCPHDTFLANDGKNNFAHYPDSWLDWHDPPKEYEEWLNKNKVKTDGC